MSNHNHCWGTKRKRNSELPEDAGLLNDDIENTEPADYDAVDDPDLDQHWNNALSIDTTAVD